MSIILGRLDRKIPFVIKRSGHIGRAMEMCATTGHGLPLSSSSVGFRFLFLFFLCQEIIDMPFFLRLAPTAHLPGMLSLAFFLPIWKWSTSAARQMMQNGRLQSRIAEQDAHPRANNKMRCSECNMRQDAMERITCLKSEPHFLVHLFIRRHPCKTPALSPSCDDPSANRHDRPAARRPETNRDRLNYRRGRRRAR